MTESTCETGMVPVEEAAAMLKTTPLNILMHLKRMLLEGKEIDGRWYVSEPSLTAFRDGHEGPDRNLCQKGCSNKGCGSCA